MNGKILEEVYNRNVPYSDRIRIPFLFQGQYYDHETGLAYNRFRYYDPELGRYISEDPIRFASGTLALHSYVEDSNSWVDVLGLSSYKKSSKSLLKKAKLPRKGKMRFIPSKSDLMRGKLSTQKVGNETGFVDKFGNVWLKGTSRTNGEAFEWDVQLTKTRGELFKRSGLSSDGKHLNVSLQGRITH